MPTRTTCGGVVWTEQKTKTSEALTNTTKTRFANIVICNTKMDQKWIRVLVILLICRQMTSGAGDVLTVKEGQQIDISCTPGGTGTMVIWFRVLDTSSVEFIASFSTTGILKSPPQSFSSTFSYSLSKQNTLTLKSFNKAKDSGVYSCGSLFRGNELRFGKATRLVGVKVPVTAPPPPQAATTQQKLCTTATPCVCSNTNKPGETSPQLFCSLIILGPLAGGCGLLLLLLIATTIYCNQIRTRRCPHHYKRKPRVVAPGKPKMNNRPV